MRLYTNNLSIVFLNSKKFQVSDGKSVLVEMPTFFQAEQWVENNSAEHASYYYDDYEQLSDLKTAQAERLNKGK